MKRYSSDEIQLVLNYFDRAFVYSNSFVNLSPSWLLTINFQINFISSCVIVAIFCFNQYPLLTIMQKNIFLSLTSNAIL